MKTSRHILVTEMPYLLLSFLIERKILGSFLDGTLRFNDFYDELKTKKWTNSTYSIYRIGTIFMCVLVWRAMPQGYEFWSNINEEWESLCRQKIL